MKNLLLCALAVTALYFIPTAHAQSTNPPPGWRFIGVCYDGGEMACGSVYGWTDIAYDCGENYSDGPCDMYAPPGRTVEEGDPGDD